MQNIHGHMHEIEWAINDKLEKSRKNVQRDSDRLRRRTGKQPNDVPTSRDGTFDLYHTDKRFPSIFSRILALYSSQFCHFQRIRTNSHCIIHDQTQSPTTRICFATYAWIVFVFIATCCWIYRWNLVPCGRRFDRLRRQGNIHTISCQNKTSRDHQIKKKQSQVSYHDESLQHTIDQTSSMVLGGIRSNHLLWQWFYVFSRSIIACFGGMWKCYVVCCNGFGHFIKTRLFVVSDTEQVCLDGWLGWNSFSSCCYCFVTLFFHWLLVHSSISVHAYLITFLSSHTDTLTSNDTRQFNGGFMVIRPNQRVFDALMKNLDLADGQLFPDQVRCNDKLWNVNSFQP